MRFQRNPRQAGVSEDRTGSVAGVDREGLDTKAATVDGTWIGGAPASNGATLS